VTLDGKAPFSASAVPPGRRRSDRTAGSDQLAPSEGNQMLTNCRLIERPRCRCSGGHHPLRNWPRRRRPTAEGLIDLDAPVTFSCNVVAILGMTSAPRQRPRLPGPESGSGSLIDVNAPGTVRRNGGLVGGFREPEGCPRHPGRRSACTWLPRAGAGADRLASRHLGRTSGTRSRRRCRPFEPPGPWMIRVVAAWGSSLKSRRTRRRSGGRCRHPRRGRGRLG